MPHTNFRLASPRLIFRQFTLEDAPLVFALNSQPEVTKYLHEPLLKDVAHARKILEDIILPQYELNRGRWALHTKTDGTFIGWCGLKQLPGQPGADLGFRLHPFAWGQGFATEAAAHSLRYGFGKLQLLEIFGKAHIDNLSSIRVLQKCGMQLTGIEYEGATKIKVFRAVTPQLCT